MTITALVGVKICFLQSNLMKIALIIAKALWLLKRKKIKDIRPNLNRLVFVEDWKLMWLGLRIYQDVVMIRLRRIIITIALVIIEILEFLKINGVKIIVLERQIRNIAEILEMPGFLMNLLVIYFFLKKF